MKKQKRVVIYTDKPLSKEERKNFSKNNPGKRLAFHLRFPNFPIYVSVVALICQLAVLLARLLLLR